MKQTITAIVVQVEVTPFNDEGKAMLRDKPIVFPAAEADLPDPVLEWVREMISKRMPNGV